MGTSCSIRAISRKLAQDAASPPADTAAAANLTGLAFNTVDESELEPATDAPAVETTDEPESSPAAATPTTPAPADAALTSPPVIDDSEVLDVSTLEPATDYDTVVSGTNGTVVDAATTSPEVAATAPPDVAASPAPAAAASTADREPIADTSTLEPAADSDSGVAAQESAAANSMAAAPGASGAMADAAPFPAGNGNGSSLPAWAAAVIAIAVIASVAALAVVALLVVRRRRRNAASAFETGSAAVGYSRYNDKQSLAPGNKATAVMEV